MVRDISSQIQEGLLASENEFSWAFFTADCQTCDQNWLAGDKLRS
jgi:hypothetical protein